MSSKPKLESIVGDLRAVKEFVLGTLRETYQLMDERRTCPDKKLRAELRNNGHYGGDGNFYYSEESKLYLAITDTKHNLILKHLDDEVDSSFDQLTNQENYFADSKEFKRILILKSTTRIDYSQLRLKKYNDEASFLVIGTDEGYSKLDPEEQKLAVRKGHTPENLKMLKEAGIVETRIWLLNSEYAHNLTKDGKVVGRVSWLGNFCCNSDAGAGDRLVYDQDRLRGVRLEGVAEGDAPKKSIVPSDPKETLESHLNYVLNAKPKEIARLLDDSKAGRLSQYVAEYLAGKKQ